MKPRPLLEQITSAPLDKACDVPWSAMSGGDRFRHCAECDREVWNLSAMTAREAEIRLLNAATTPCVNYRVDGDGRLISRDEPLSSRRLGLRAAALVAGSLLGGGVASADPPPAQKQESGKTPQDSGKTPQGSGKTPQAAAPAPAPAPPPAPSKKAPPSQAARAFNPEDCPRPASPSAPGAVAFNNNDPPPLAGAPPMPRDPAPQGTVQLLSAKPRDVTVDGVAFKAPASIALPPGRHVVQFKNGTKTVSKAVEIRMGSNVPVDLDR
jgi:hypothetical protein